MSKKKKWGWAPFGRVDRNLWTDPAFKAMRPLSRLAYVTTIAGPSYSRVPGLLLSGVHASNLAFEMGVPLADATSTLAELAAARFMLTDDEGRAWCPHEVTSFPPSPNEIIGEGFVRDLRTLAASPLYPVVFAALEEAFIERSAGAWRSTAKLLPTPSPSHTTSPTSSPSAWGTQEKETTSSVVSRGVVEPKEAPPPHPPAPGGMSSAPDGHPDSASSSGRSVKKAQRSPSGPPSEPQLSAVDGRSAVISREREAGQRNGSRGKASRLDSSDATPDVEMSEVRARRRR